MKPDYDSLINAGLSKEEIAKISGCEDQEMGLWVFIGFYTVKGLRKITSQSRRKE